MEGIGAIVAADSPLSPGRQQRLQSAVEYLSTYSWAILVLAIAIGALYLSGLLSPNRSIPDTCISSPDFTCLSTSLTADGLLTVDIAQNTKTPVNVTSVGCSTNQSETKNLLTPSPSVYLPIGGDAKFTMTCFSNGTAFTGRIGSTFKGFIIVNYRNLHTQFPGTSTMGVIAQVRLASTTIPP